MDATWGYLLEFNPLLIQHRLPAYAAAIVNRGAPIANIVLFIDGTLPADLSSSPQKTFADITEQYR
jgi:hypothetical protein